MNEYSSYPEWAVIINPVSGNGKGRHDWETISALLKQSGISFGHYFTEYPRHGVDLAAKLIRSGCLKFIVVGGDGILNEVVNGIFSQNEIDCHLVTLAMIPVGTGNDWARSFSIPFEYAGAVKTIKMGKTSLQDIGKVFYRHNDEERCSYFINMCGMGFDAEVNRKVNADKGHGHNGPLKYKYHIFTTLLSYDPVMIKLNVDGIPSFHETFSLTVAIGKYNGGGMMQSPYAVPDDGIFNVTIIRKISKVKVLANVKRLYDGSFTKLKEVICLTGNEISVDALPGTWLEADGESLGSTPIRFKMLPLAINIITA